MKILMQNTMLELRETGKLGGNIICKNRREMWSIIEISIKET